MRTPQFKIYIKERVDKISPFSVLTSLSHFTIILSGSGTLIGHEWVLISDKECVNDIENQEGVKIQQNCFEILLQTDYNI